MITSTMFQQSESYPGMKWKRLPFAVGLMVARYCVVMPKADLSLHEALAHEHFAGIDMLKVRMIATHLGEALAHLHEKGIIHADFKPLNAYRRGLAPRITWPDLSFDQIRRISVDVFLLKNQ